MKHNQASNWNGRKATKTYRSWTSFVQRCTNKNHSHYKTYKNFYYEPWKDFTQFYLDMGERPEGTSLDRIDNTKGYSPENCRWADSSVQQRNRNTTRLDAVKACSIRVAFFIHKHTIKDLAEAHSVSQSTIKNVLYRGDWA